MARRLLDVQVNQIEILALTSNKSRRDSSTEQIDRVNARPTRKIKARILPELHNRGDFFGNK